MMSNGSRFSVSSWVKLGYSAYAISRALVLLPVSKEINQDCGQEPEPSRTTMFVMLTIACQVLNLTGGASSVRGASCDQSKPKLECLRSQNISQFCYLLCWFNMCISQQRFLLFVSL